MPTRAAYRLEPFATVMVGAGGPSASVSREIFQVFPPMDALCGDVG